MSGASAMILPESQPVRPRMSVRAADGRDSAAWNRFVEAHPDGSFYHLFEWKPLFESVLGHRGHYLVCESGGEIEGVLPLVHVRSRLFGNALSSLPFLVYGGPLAASEAALASLIEQAQALADDLGVDHLEFRNRRPVCGDLPTKTSYVTFRKRIDPDPEKNFTSIPRKQRAMVRKGIEAGLVAEPDGDTRRLYRTLLECKRNLGTPFFAESWLAAIKSAFGERAEVLIVTHEGRLVSGVMSFRFRDEILPYYGGGGNLARDLKGNDFMYWAVMERACRDGVKIFDYGRSSVDSGAYRFKKHWGFEPEPLHYQYYLVNSREIPNLNPANPRFRWLIHGWQRLPLPVAGFLGPFIARNLG